MWSGYGQIVAAGIAKKRWRQYIRDFEVVLRAPGLELRGESLGHTRVVIPGDGDVFLCRYLVGGIARLCSDYFFRVKTLIPDSVVGSGNGGA